LLIKHLSDSSHLAPIAGSSLSSDHLAVKEALCCRLSTENERRLLAGPECLLVEERFTNKPKKAPPLPAGDEFGTARSNALRR